MTLHHGISVTEVPNSTRPIATVATAVIGLVATGDNADLDVFPLNTPVKVTVIRDAIAKAGALGTLAHALRAIGDQVRTTIVVVRINTGADAAEANAFAIGADTNGVKSGMQALLAAEAQIGVRPRIIGAPGLDTEPVAKALAQVAKRLRAMAYAGAVGADRQAVVAYRAKFTERELMLLWPDFTAPLGVAGTDVPSYAVARALGLRAQIDQTQGFHKTLSNVAVAGVDGLTKDVQFDIQDPDSDSAILNAAQVEQINAKFRALTRTGQILGAEAEFRADRNPVESLKAGQLVISYRYTPVPPLEALGLEQQISDEFLADFAGLVAGA